MKHICIYIPLLDFNVSSDFELECQEGDIFKAVRYDSKVYRCNDWSEASGSICSNIY